MASVYDLKSKFQSMLRPICGVLARAGVSANSVTIAALLLSVGWGGAFSFTGSHLLLTLLPLLLFIRMGMNAIDGILAREFNQQSNIGAFLNELGDILSDLAIYLPFALIAGLSSALLIAFVILALIVEFTGVLGLMIGASRRYDGPFGKSDRAVFFGFGGLLIGFGVTPEGWTSVALWAACFLSVWTIVNRIRCALKEADNG